MSRVHSSSMAIDNHRGPLYCWSKIPVTFPDRVRSRAKLPRRGTMTYTVRHTRTPVARAGQYAVSRAKGGVQPLEYELGTRSWLKVRHGHNHPPFASPSMRLG